MANSGVCENCQFWVQTGATDDGLLGECHRNSPLPDLTGSSSDSKMRFAVWPSTLENNWCGSFEERAMANDELIERMAIIQQMEKERKKQ